MAAENLLSFIGQSTIKRQLSEKMLTTYRSGDPLPHLLLCGPPEMGKVTLARAIAGEMGVAARHISGSIKTKGDLAGVLSRTEARDIVIVEEPGDLRAEVLSMLTEAISDQKMDIEIGTGPGSRLVTMDLKAFTFVVTTSKPWQLPETFRRWFIAMDFEPYDREEVADILSQVAADDGLHIEAGAARLMAGHCRGNPGNALALLKRIKRHHGSVMADAPIGREAAQRILDFLGYDHEEGATVVLADLLRSMSGLDFERFVADLFRKTGHSVELTPGSGDHGVDILIHKSGQIGAIQCKRWLDPVGEPVVRDFLGSMVGAGAAIGYVATTSSFTEQAKAFAHRQGINLLDLESLVQMAGAGSTDTPIPPVPPLF